MTTGQLEKGAELKAALEGCGALDCPGPEVTRLWLEIRDCICTRGRVDVVPYGSSRPVTVTEDYAGDELLSAMEWLIKNEDKARSLGAESLFAHISAEAKRSAKGSGRAARNDQLHGMTACPQANRSVSSNSTPRGRSNELPRAGPLDRRRTRP